MLKARPTIYKGVRMRSRLEATFAALCDELREPWQYEPNCFASEDGQYLPDFALIGRTEPTYVEVKPFLNAATCAKYANAVHIIRASEPRAAMWLWTPTIHLDWHKGDWQRIGTREVFWTDGQPDRIYPDRSPS